MSFLLKITGIAIVVFSTSSYGMLLCKDIRLRLTELKELKKIMFLLKGEIEFGKTPLLEAAKNIAIRCDTVFAMALKKLAACSDDVKKETIDRLWKKSFLGIMPQCHLTKNEKERILSLGDCMGLKDSKTQLTAIDSYMDELAHSINELEKTMPSKIKLYRSLGVMSGIVISIIMV